MVSGVRFFACSGAMGGQPNNRPEISALEIFDITASPGDTTAPLRLGFFGIAGAPNSTVLVGNYQDRTHRVDHFGTDLGVFINQKFLNSSTAEVSGVSTATTGADLQDVPAESGTILARFREPNDVLVTTQNAVFRAIVLSSTSGATTGSFPSEVTIQAYQLPDTDGYAGDTAWTEITAGNLGLEDQSASATVHDWHIAISLSPDQTGQLRDFGFFLQTEFL